MLTTEKITLSHLESFRFKFAEMLIAKQPRTKSGLLTSKKLVTALLEHREVNYQSEIKEFITHE